MSKAPHSVQHYDSTSGTLLLTHSYPEPPARQVVARVNVDHVLETTRSVELQTGAWINVIGYVSERDEGAGKSREDGLRAAQVGVQALLLWSAGTLKLDDYEKALLARKECGAAG